MAIQLYLVRHGQTYFNLTKRLQGFSDAPLTAAGIEHGHDAGRRLQHIHFSGAYSSDLTRAIHTAKYLLSENKAGSPTWPQQLSNFREENFGSLEGIDSQVAMTQLNAFSEVEYNSYSDMIQKLGMKGAMNLFKKADPYHLAESYDAFMTRIQKGFDFLLKEHQEGDNVLVVAHGTAIRAIVDHFGHPEMANESIANGAVTKIILSEKGGQVDVFNDNKSTF
ncbi:histidine phosphatase family protein [Fructobacillus sp. M1-13]|uniref:Histidine phosphatase family protein n=1 Tax=Fructobacillus papyriferae TaxID=2713171 RepID=A0ABS5QR80_9LACO|nr:histidine phosphatase family protein [Fructobacillus papyriferae]MBS9335327.1 histidine phosphatase family protein [Fructobacillus papyriferae]MCD2159004.1 histidine phosphatase family protein [Fructobacillus papyriferae]